MGNWYETIVDLDVTEAEAPRLAEQMRVWLIEREIIKAAPRKRFLGSLIYRPGPAYPSTLEEPNPSPEIVNGLELVVGRTVFYQLGLELTCKTCGAQLKDEGEDESWELEPWHDAINAWWSGEASVVYACPKCGVPERLTEWRGNVPWYFGYLGLQFWDWSPLSERFIQEVTKQLGHRTGVLSSKL